MPLADGTPHLFRQASILAMLLVPAVCGRKRRASACHQNASTAVAMAPGGTGCQSASMNQSRGWTWSACSWDLNESMALGAQNLLLCAAVGAPSICPLPAGMQAGNPLMGLPLLGLPKQVLQHTSCSGTEPQLMEHCCLHHNHWVSSQSTLDVEARGMSAVVWWMPMLPGAALLRSIGGHLRQQRVCPAPAWPRRLFSGRAWHAAGM